MDRFEPNLRIPGPTALPPSVRTAGGRQMINHRGPEFAAMLDRILTGMKPFFGTTGDIAMLTCAGSGGLEAAVVNTLSPGDRVLGVSIGSFGDRFAKIAGIYGANVTKLDVEWGQAADPGAVREALAADPSLQGRAADPQRDLDRRDEPDPGSRGGDPRRRPGRADPRRQRVGPGRGPVRDGRLGRRPRRHRLAEGVHGRAGSRVRRRLGARLGRDGAATMPRFYLDLRSHRDAAKDGQTPFTPAIAVVYQVDEGVRLMQRRARPGSSPGTRRARRPRGPASRRSGSSCSPTSATRRGR